jgi:16S rRNA (guanine1207-N2)-methyltransferase
MADHADRRREPLSNPSQLLLRNLHRLRGRQPLVVHYPDDGFLAQLITQAPECPVTAFGEQYTAYRRAQRLQTSGALAGVDLHFAASYAPTAALHDAALIFLPKSRPLLEMTVAMVAAACQPGAQIWLVGENRAGIRTAQSSLAQSIGLPRTLDTGRHSLLLEATLQTTAAPFQLDAWISPYAVDLDDQPLSVITLPGVFSYGRLDEGTKLLLSSLTQPPAATVLDLGCGAGVIGAFVKRRWPHCQVDLADVSALALEATRRTWTANGLGAANLIPSDLFADVRGRYGTILANPPFHTGIEAEYGLVRRFVQGAHHHLPPGGVLHFVTQRSIRIQPLVEAEIGVCGVVAQTAQYTVYRATKTVR